MSINSELTRWKSKISHYYLSFSLSLWLLNIHDIWQKHFYTFLTQIHPFISASSTARKRRHGRSHHAHAHQAYWAVESVASVVRSRSGKTHTKWWWPDSSPQGTKDRAAFCTAALEDLNVPVQLRYCVRTSFTYFTSNIQHNTAWILAPVKTCKILKTKMHISNKFQPWIVYTEIEPHEKRQVSYTKPN